MLEKIALEDNDTVVRTEAIKKLDNEEILTKIAKTEADRLARQSAVKKLTSQETLVAVALEDEDQFVREHAINNPSLSDEECFVEIAINTPFKETADEAIEHIENESSFIQILHNA